MARCIRPRRPAQAKRADEVKQFIGTIFQTRCAHGSRWRCAGLFGLKLLSARASHRARTGRKPTWRRRVGRDRCGRAFVFLGVRTWARRHCAPRAVPNPNLGRRMITIRAGCSWPGIMKHREPKVAEELFDSVIRVGDGCCLNRSSWWPMRGLKKASGAQNEVNRNPPFRMMQRAVEYAESHLGQIPRRDHLLPGIAGRYPWIAIRRAIAHRQRTRLTVRARRAFPISVLQHADGRRTLLWHGTAACAERPATLACPLFERALADQRVLTRWTPAAVRHARTVLLFRRLMKHCRICARWWHSNR